MSVRFQPIARGVKRIIDIFIIIFDIVLTCGTSLDGLKIITHSYNCTRTLWLEQDDGR